MKKIITLLIVFLLVLSVSGREEISSSDIKVELKEVNFWSMIFGFIEQSIMIGDTKALIVGETTSILFSFTALCPSADRVYGYVDINHVIKGPQLKTTLKSGQTLTCNQPYNLRVSFTPKYEGNYEVGYGLVDITSSKSDECDVEIDTESGIVCNGEEETFTAKVKQTTFTPYCDDGAKATIYDNNIKVGSKIEKICYSAPNTYKETVEITCIDGYEIKDIEDYWTATCVKREPLIPPLIEPPSDDDTKDNVTKGNDKVCLTVMTPYFIYHKDTDSCEEHQATSSCIPASGYSDLESCQENIVGGELGTQIEFEDWIKDNLPLLIVMVLGIITIGYLIGRRK